jgi:signal transduction histidine kinase
MKNTTKLTVFSALLLTVIIFIMYALLISDINADMRSMGLEYTYSYAGEGLAILIVITLLLSYVASALLIDQILNPIRLMITKVKAVEKMDFNSPLVIHARDEELQEYVSAFNSMAQSLRGYIERQKRFVSDASHELTTPITVINGHTDLLLRHRKTRPELLDGGLEIIKAEALRMSELVDSLLLLARSDDANHSYAFERHGLIALIRESISEVKLIAPDFAITEEIAAGEIYSLCDAYAIRRVLRIIFSNAVKYAGECTVSAYASHGLAYICVRDDGTGIGAAHLPKIFDRFYRVDESRVKKTGSSGLGLAIAREIIRAHNGDITAESEPGKGTAFTVMLPSIGF